MEQLLVYDYCLRLLHRDQHVVDAHSDNFRIDVTLFLLSHTILICGAVCYGQAYQRLLINQGNTQHLDKGTTPINVYYTLMGVVPLSK